LGDATRVYYCENPACSLYTRKKNPPRYCPRCGGMMYWYKELIASES